VVTPRSFCPECDHGIAWYDNVPVLSYMLLRGRCRNCKARIPVRYPLVELLTAICFFAAVRIAGMNGLGIKQCVFAAILIALAFADLEARILPDEFTIGGAVLGIVLAALVPAGGGLWRLLIPSLRDPRMFSVLDAAFAAVFSSVTLWLVGFVYEKVRHREGLGLGDVKMIAMIGAFLGLQGVLLTLMLGSILGAIIGIAFILITRKDAASYELPFGAFLGFAALAVSFWGEIAAKWYGRLGA
jgi:leader peptidase (prepilin peptidase)/N-methyltransferase